MKRVIALIAVAVIIGCFSIVTSRRPGSSAKAGAARINTDSGKHRDPVERPVSATAAAIISAAAKLDDPFRDKYLRNISSSNAAFQAWGKQKILGEVNRVLERTPFYGLSGPLTESNTIGTAELYSGMNSGKWQLWLHTADKKCRFRYEDGRLYEMYSIDGDYLRNGNKPLDEALRDWAESSSQWSDAAAQDSFKELLKKLDLPLKSDEPGSRIEVEPFEIDYEGKSVTPFYTVRLFAPGNVVSAEVHYRATKSGWQPTLVNFWIKGAADNIPSANDLIARFF